MTVPDLGIGPCTMSIYDYVVAWGSTPRAAVRHFNRRMWEIALGAITNPGAYPAFIERHAMNFCFHTQPLNWHRAVRARSRAASDDVQQETS